MGSTVSPIRHKTQQPLPEIPFGKGSPAELPWRPGEEEPTVAPHLSRSAHPLETADSWEKGAGCRPPEVPAPTLAFIFNEPFSKCFTSRQAGIVCSQQGSPEPAVNGFPSAPPPCLGSAQPLWMKGALCRGHSDHGHGSLCPLFGLSKPTPICLGNAFMSAN